MKQADALRHAFLGLDFDRLDAQAAARKVLTLARGNRFSYIVTPNVDHVVQLDRSGDSELAGAYRGADLCLCDSRNLARLARWSGIDLPVVTGSDLTRDLLVTVLPRAKLAVVGGDERIHRDLEALFPRFEWSFHTPPMGIRRDSGARTAIAEFVETVDADVVFLAVGAPQSEMICAEISQRGRARRRPVHRGVARVFDWGEISCALVDAARRIRMVVSLAQRTRTPLAPLSSRWPENLHSLAAVEPEARRQCRSSSRLVRFHTFWLLVKKPT